MKLPRRLSIAGLMTIVLIVSLGLVALRSESAASAGGVYLLTYAVLLLGIVGAICRTGRNRVWWLGFALFGIAFFQWIGHFGIKRLTLPTTILLNLVRPAGVRPSSYLFGDGSEYYWLVGHCFWSLLAAMVGGALALAVFAVAVSQSTTIDSEPRQEIPPARVKWRRVAAVGLAFFVPGSALILVGLLSNPALWASLLYLSTWALLGTLVLGFACGRGKRRMIWFGAALFGLGYMFLNRSGDAFEQSSYAHLVADEFLESVRPMLPEVVSGFPAKTAAIANEHARIRKILDRTISLSFSDEFTLERFLNEIREKTKDPAGRELAIYVDPIALSDSDKTMQSTIHQEFNGRPLGTILRATLRQLNLSPYLRDGMLYITSEASSADLPVEIDFYLLVGHCILAMISAGLGALLVPLVSNRDA